ncbi:MAG: siderophore-interacting protein [Actinobacteria bacterium HGW-Actinobacteria-5]|jgi:NADPH-dependent ferric siderophore reductase|nr:MAG: siderophore-interacting protein [Actinobacteria bacterium HGW-Actinobacteria-5]
MTLTTPAAFETVPLDTALRPAELVSREWLTRGYVRVRLEGDRLRGFHAPGADDHVRLFFAPADGPLPATPEEWRELPSREYTPLNADPVAGWVEFDLVVHGDGPGSEWAATAPAGSRVAVAGPRRSNAITGDPDAWFLAGDETAIPAITRFLRSRRPGTPARVIVEVAPENELVPLPSDAGTHVTVLVRGADSLADTLAALGESDRPEGSVLGFVAAESAVVPIARTLLLEHWALPPEAVITKGYWRHA